MLRRDSGKEVRVEGEVEKAARSAMRRAGWVWIVPRREMRRPAWSEERRRVRRKWGRRVVGSVVELGAVGVVMVWREVDEPESQGKS